MSAGGVFPSRSLPAFDTHQAESTRVPISSPYATLFLPPFLNPPLRLLSFSHLCLVHNPALASSHLPISVSQSSSCLGLGAKQLSLQRLIQRDSCCFFFSCRCDWDAAWQPATGRKHPVFAASSPADAPSGADC